MSIIEFLEDSLPEDTLVLKQTPTNSMVKSFGGKDFVYVSNERFDPERVSLEAEYTSGQSVNILYFTKTLSPIEIIREIKKLHSANNLHSVNIVSCVKLPELFTEYTTYTVNIIINEII